MSVTQMMDRSPTLGPNGVVIQNWSDTDINVHNVNYVWVIHGYVFHKAKLMKGEALKSSIFATGSEKGCKWFLEFYPNGKAGSNENYSSLYLRLDDTSDYTYVYGRFKFSLLDKNMEEFNSCPDNKEIIRFDRGNGYGISNFFESDYNQLSLNNTLTIYCEVIFSLVDHFTTFNHYNSTTVECNVSERLIEDLKRLFKNEESADVVLTVNGIDYKAHKTILIARSPVFAAMFKHEDTLENRLNKVNITDFSERAIEEMLNYIYTDMPENLEELAVDLLAVAEKYGLEGLKDMAESVLIKNLSIENALDTLEFSDLHLATKLKSYTLNFIAAKSAEVMKTAAWKNIEQSKLVFEVCEALALSKKQRIDLN